ncbi:6312_t:CDS:2 [Cetraspora pellucida]|uniref:6312_t:CDS:1 n=1 Tax=Cetraspora pellucida TaxID=1433469 RepID=A0ACA9K337_9GLOM|nr:6312_t:CDS:2 [Cetraspora pellucida]
MDDLLDLPSTLTNKSKKVYSYCKTCKESEKDHFTQIEIKIDMWPSLGPSYVRHIILLEDPTVSLVVPPEGLMVRYGNAFSIWKVA